MAPGVPRQRACASVQAPLQAAAADSESRKAFDDLGAHYSRNEDVPYDDALGDLAGPDSTKWRAAGAYLLALFRQSVADESNGRAPRHGTPYWGGGMESEARKFREELASEFGERASGSSAVPAIIWLLEHEPVPAIQASGLQAMRQLGDSTLAPIASRLLGPPHTNASIVLLAVREIGRRHLAGFTSAISSLCSDPRPSVRRNARNAADSLGVRPPPEPALATLLTPELRDDLDAIRKMVMTPIPRSARMATVHASFRSPYRDTMLTRVYPAWVLDKRGGTYRTLDIFGVDRREPKQLTRLAPWSLRQEVERLRTTRDAGSSHELSSGGAITGQFEPGTVTVPEALAAAWSLERGDRESAAAILLPRLEAMDDERQLRPILGSLLGTTYYKEMLKAFSYDRDYEATLRYANHLSQSVFGGFYYQPVASELGEQLTHRRDDFVTLTLPDSSEWKSLQDRLTRAQQVDFLAHRLRLLNSFQAGQPGGVATLMTQYERPWHKTDPWDEKPNNSRPLVNPLEELLALHLDVAEIPLLLPHLTDRDFAPTFGFWRDFHPAWDLFRVGVMAEDVINGIAQRPLVHVSEIVPLDSLERQQYFTRIASWCHSHAGMTPQDLDLDVLKTTTSANEFEMAARKRAMAKDQRAAELIVSRIGEFRQDEQWLLEYLYMLDSPAGVPIARRCLNEPVSPNTGDVMQRFTDQQRQFYAGLILLGQGDRSVLEGLSTVDAVLATDSDGSYYRIAKAVLDSIPAERLRKARCGMLGSGAPDLRGAQSDTNLRRLIRLGCENAYDFLLRALDSKAPRGIFDYEDPVTHVHVRRSMIEGDDAAIVVGSWRRRPYSLASPDAVRRRARAESRAWLVEQFRKIRSGEPSEIR